VGVKIPYKRNCEAERGKEAKIRLWRTKKACSDTSESQKKDALRFKFKKTSKKLFLKAKTSLKNSKIYAVRRKRAKKSLLNNKKGSQT
jgi:hypothetical protein